MNSGAGRRRGRARVADHRSVAPGYREMSLVYADDGTFESAREIALPRPGCFFTLLPVTFPVPLLRRPFAYADANKKGFSFLYEIRGKATQRFSTLETGDIVDWIGPLGTGFPDPPEDALPILTAGGIGIGPILYLARSLVNKGILPTIVLGTRTADFVPEILWPKGADLHICTEDGSAGINGTVLDGLPKNPGENAVYYCCGPLPMMAAVHKLAVSGGNTCWVSLEERMACGVGACNGCAVQTVPELQKTADDTTADSVYKCTCTDGPVFDSREVVW